MKERVEFLLEKYRTGKMAEPEIDELYSILSSLQKDGEKRWRQSDLERHLQAVKPFVEAQRKRSFPSGRLRYAACAALFLACGWGYVYFSSKTPEQSPGSGLEIAENGDRPAGTFKAYVRESDDADYVLLDSSSPQMIGLSDKKEHKEEEWLSIRTPARTEYKIELEDGSLLWVNARSTVRFPARFSTDKREVYVTGDVLLDVRHRHGVPFLVYTEQQQIRVEGTLFHVRADKDGSTATLIEGSVVASNVDGTGTVRIRPGESVRGENGQQRHATASVEEILAWREGYFYFEDRPLAEVLQKLSAWYDIGIVSTGVDTSVKLTARMAKDKSLTEMARILARATGIRFTLDNNTLTLKNKPEQ